MYTDFELFPRELGLVPLLLPFAPAARRPPREAGVRAARFDRLERELPRWYRLVARADAEIGVLAAPWSALRGHPARVARAQRFAASLAPKPVLVYDVSDLEDEVPIENAWVLRTSCRRSRRRAREICMPGFSEDLLLEHAPDALARPPGARPTVSFRGVSEPLVASRWLELKARVLRAADARGVVLGNYGNQVRRAALMRLVRSRRLGTSIEVQPGFFGGAQRARGGVDLAQQAAARRCFVDSIVGSDYVLCVRGAGNYSFRFFETLCLGRTPLVVDTDSVFPLRELIDPRSFSVWVPLAELDRIEELVLAHFEALRGDAESERRRLRAIWEEHYSPHGFFSALARLLRARLGAGQG